MNKGKVEFNRKYVSGLMSNAELHAGGLFFYIIYQKCLEFSKRGTVLLTYRVFDAFRPMDDSDVIQLETNRLKVNGLIMREDI